MNKKPYWAPGRLFETARTMKNPVVYGNPVTFGPVDWNYPAGTPVRRGKSVEELGDAGWARERERMAHLQHLQQLHQMQLHQQQVAYPGYPGVPPGQPQGPVMAASPGDPVPAPGCLMPVHASIMPVQRGPTVAVVGVGPPPVHVPAQWPVQWEAHMRQGAICHQPNWEYDEQHKAALIDKRPQGQNVYFHPGSEDGHLDVRISEWKGKHCFYQGPEDYGHQDYIQEKDNSDLRRPEGYSKLDEDRRGRDNWVRENDHNAQHHGHRSQRDLEEYDHVDKYKHRDHYGRNYDERYDDRKQHYDDRRHRERHFSDSYNSEYEDYYDRKDTYARRDKYWDRDQYYDRKYYDPKEGDRHGEKDYHQWREEDHYDERKHYYDRNDDHYEPREHTYRDRDVSNRRGEESRKRRCQYDSELDEHHSYEEKDNYYRYKDTDRRDDHYNHRRKDHYKAKEHYERRHHYDEREDHHNRTENDPYDSREGRSHHKPRDRYRDLRSMSAESHGEEFPKKDRKTHCEEWVEQQNQKMGLRTMQSYEDPIVYRHSEEQEKGYESSAGSARSKRGRKPVYVGSLDRNSFSRKTAQSSLRKSPFTSNGKQNQGKHKGTVM